MSHGLLRPCLLREAQGIDAAIDGAIARIGRIMHVGSCEDLSGIWRLDVNKHESHSKDEENAPISFINLQKISVEIFPMKKQITKHGSTSIPMVSQNQLSAINFNMETLEVGNSVLYWTCEQWLKITVFRVELRWRDLCLKVEPSLNHPLKKKK